MARCRQLWAAARLQISLRGLGQQLLRDWNFHEWLLSLFMKRHIYQHIEIKSIHETASIENHHKIEAVWLAGLDVVGLAARLGVEKRGGAGTGGVAMGGRPVAGRGGREFLVVELLDKIFASSNL